MISYLVFCSLLIPVNLWAAITPHMHSDLSMRILHGISTVLLIPLLTTLWGDRQQLMKLPAVVLAVFAVVLVVVNHPHQVVVKMVDLVVDLELMAMVTTNQPLLASLDREIGVDEVLLLRMALVVEAVVLEVFVLL